MIPEKLESFQKSCDNIIIKQRRTKVKIKELKKLPFSSYIMKFKQAKSFG